MFNIADIIVLVIIVFAVFRGYKKGFIRTGFGLISFFLAIALTFMFYKPVMGVIKEKTGFEEWLTEYLNSNNVVEVQNDDLLSENSAQNYLNNLPQTIIDMLDLEEVKANAKEVIVQKIVDFVLKLLSMIIVYIVVKIILSIALLILDSIAKLPILKQFNELLGLVLGGILGFVQVYVLCAIITLISSMPAASGISVAINNSLFAHTLYNNNLLLQILF